MERMEWIEDLDGSVFYAQGIVSVDASIRIFTASCQPADSRPITTLDPLPDHFFLTRKGTQPRFSWKVRGRLKRAFRERTNWRSWRSESSLSQPKIFARFPPATVSKRLGRLLATPPFGGPEHVLQYLAATRIAWPSPTIDWSPSAMAKSLSAGGFCSPQRTEAHCFDRYEKFLRRFLLHLLPQGFVRIRTSAGSPIEDAANCFRSVALSSRTCQNKYLQLVSFSRLPALWRCPRCHGPMSVLERLTAAKLLETDRRQENASLTLPNLQLAFTLSGWPSSQLLGLCPYLWKVMTSTVDDLLWLINVYPKSEFFGRCLTSQTVPLAFPPSQETPLKTHK